MSPASGFSDTESEMGNNAPIFCPAHGPVHFVPLRYLSRHFPLLPVVQEAVNYNPNDSYDEGGSLYSTSQNSDMIIYEDKGMITPISQHNGGGNGDRDSGGGMGNGGNYMKAPSTPHPNSGLSLGFVQEWRMKQMQRRVQRSDAIYMSDDNKSSIASSPGTGRSCPRCKERDLEMESNSNPNKINSSASCLLEKQNSSTHFDSGIVADGGPSEPVKNVSFETCTSSDSAISQMGFNHYRPSVYGWKEKFYAPPTTVEEVTQTDPQNGHENGDDRYCETVTTFGVHSDSSHPKSKATDV